MLIDWSVGAEARNYRIPHRPDRRSFSDVMGSMCCLLLIAAALVGYVWIRSRIVALGYQVQSLKEQEVALQRMQNNLIAEEETLKSPERIDRIARNDLGMERLAPYQRLVPGLLDAGAQPEVLALANSHPETVPLRRPSSNN